MGQEDPIVAQSKAVSWNGRGSAAKARRPPKLNQPVPSKKEKFILSL